jgi:hypothetical protein
MGRTAKADQQAQAAPRQRQVAGHRGRAAGGERVEVAAVQAIFALGQREDALPQLLRAEDRVCEALQGIMSEGVKVNAAVHLCGPLHTRTLRDSSATATVRRRPGTAYWAFMEAHPYQDQKADPLVMP